MTLTANNLTITTGSPTYFTEIVYENYLNKDLG